MLSLRELPVVRVPRSAPVFFSVCWSIQKAAASPDLFLRVLQSSPGGPKRERLISKHTGATSNARERRRQYYVAQAQLVAGVESRRACVRLSWFKGLVLSGLSQNHLFEGDPPYVMVPILPHLGFT